MPHFSLHSSVKTRLIPSLGYCEQCHDKLGVQVLCCMLTYFPSYMCPGVGELCPYGSPIFIFWGASILISTVTALVHITTGSAQGLLFLLILTSICHLFSWWQPFDWGGMESQCGFDLQFLFGQGWWTLTSSGTSWPFVLLLRIICSIY
jgi:hypothetical protein